MSNRKNLRQAQQIIGACLNPGVPPVHAWTGHRIFSHCINAQMASYYTKPSPIVKHLTDPSLRFDLQATSSILHAAVSLKTPAVICNEIKNCASAPDYIYRSTPSIQLSDHQGRTVVEPLIFRSLRRSLKRGSTVFGNWNLHRMVRIPEPVWEAFLLAALQWWIDDGTAPPQLAEIIFGRDLGL